MDRYTYSDEARRALEALEQPIAVFQLVEGRISTILVSDGFCKLLGYADRAQAVWDMDHDMYKDTHPDDRKRISDAALRFAAGGDAYDVLFRTRAGMDSDYRVIHAHGNHIFPEPGVRLAHIWYMDEGVYVEGDESAGTQMNRELNSILHEESILRAANYDPLTGLANLAFFFKLGERSKERLLAGGKNCCLLYIDLNGMKYYNHRYGFAEGDRLLKAYAQAMQRHFGQEHCCHIGADRFAAATAEDDVQARIERFFDEIVQVQNHLPVRVGIYSTGMEDVPISVAYDRAKLACDRVRVSDASDYCWYTREMGEAEKRQRYIQSNIDRAIGERWIQVYYQPIIRAVTERICGEEALARWIDPEIGFLSPAEFIPELEASGQIYKLDLFVLERVLEKIKALEASGSSVVPQSINLSRSDFDSCDIVEEIRERVDAAGVRRELITIEITESVIGSSFDFMKAQVERFRSLGFPVWMDDFGSGYSSLDVLQSIQFDLIKFDMSFMRELDEGENAKIILTELMKMATSLGVDTVCEGVEREDQVRFLQDIGCSELQGFYYSKPMPLGEGPGARIDYENPEEAAYYEAIGRVNLYDLAVIANEDDIDLHNAFSTLPMGILEVKGDEARYIRTSQSYRDFMARFFTFDTLRQIADFSAAPAQYGRTFIKALRQCAEESNRAFFDDTMPDGSRVHTFVRRIGANPITGSVAIAVAILSISAPDERLLIDQLLSMIEQFGKHMPGGFFIYKADGSEELLYANKGVCDIYGCDSLDQFKALTGYTFKGMVHPEDYERVSASIRDQAHTGDSDLDFLEYRIVRSDGAVRWLDDHSQYMASELYEGLYFVFISDITDKYVQAESDKALRVAVIEALTRPYDSVWLIKDIETQRFELFRIDEKLAHLMPAKAAVQLKRFYDAFAFYSRLVLEEDRGRFLDAVTPQSILANTQDSLIYSVPFRRVFENGIRDYRVEFTRLKLETGEINIVVGFKDMNAQTRD